MTIQLVSGVFSLFTDNILTETEKEFNLTVVYGADVDIATVINAAKRYPMMSEHQVVVVKEAQNIRNMEELSYYLQKPLLSTKALGFSLFLICTMLIIQGLFYSRNQTVLFSVLGVSFYKEGLIYATTLGCRVLVIILTSGFFMVTTSISENAAYLELSGLSYKTVYVLMSVCYILPEMMRNMRKIQQAQKVRGTNPQKTLIQKLKSVLPVLIPLVIKTLDQSMARSISLQLRGFDNPNRTVRTSQRVYRLSRTLHIGLTGLAILLIGWKIWTKINGL